MRFFSNEKDARDEQGVDVQDRADTPPVDADVPHQRAGSPWSDGPAGSPDPTFTEPVADDRRDDPPVDLPLDDKDETRTEDTTPPDHAAADTAPDALADDTVRDDAVRDDAVRDDAVRDDAVAGNGNEVRDENNAVKDEGTFDDPQAVDPVTDKPLDESADSSSDSSDRSVDSVDGSADSVDSSDGTDRDKSDVAPFAAGVAGVAGGAAAGYAATKSTEDRKDDNEPVIATAPVTSTPVGETADLPVAGSRPEPVEPVVVATATPVTATTPAATSDSDKLFGEAGDVRERWRDVQLRFVDSPKEATADAANLVDEVLDKLTAALRARKDSLTGDGSDDTEKLRVELRGYRDMMNRILDL